jgi:hypothetical protein
MRVVSACPNYMQLSPCSGDIAPSMWWPPPGRDGQRGGTLWTPRSAPSKCSLELGCKAKRNGLGTGPQFRASLNLVSSSVTEIVGHSYCVQYATYTIGSPTYKSPSTPETYAACHVDASPFFLDDAAATDDDDDGDADDDAPAAVVFLVDVFFAAEGVAASPLSFRVVRRELCVWVGRVCASLRVRVRRCVCVCVWWWWWEAHTYERVRRGTRHSRPRI